MMSAEAQNPFPVVIRQTDGTKIHEIAGHKFQASALSQPTFCSFCSKFIYGIGKQGYKCLGCETVIHKRCHSFVTARCTFAPTARPPVTSESTDEGPYRRRSSVSISDESESQSNGHNFIKRLFTKPTFCDHCGSMLYGLKEQGLQCSDCNANVHFRCEEKVSQNCGVQLQ